MALIVNDPSSSSSSGLMATATTDTPSHSHISHIPQSPCTPSSSTPCFILPEQLDYSPTSYLEPTEGEPVTSTSPCKCGTWYFPSLPPSLGGCGHIYRVQPHVCNEQHFPFPCPGVEWPRKIRSSYYVLGLCPACRVVPAKLASYKEHLDVLNSPDSVEKALTLLLAAQDFFEEEQKKNAAGRR